MDINFQKLCRFYLDGSSNKELEELKSVIKNDFKYIQKKALKFTKKLKAETNKLGQKANFEGFCNLLEDYINKKDNMSDNDKSKYLKILKKLSDIYEINLREELERYISYKVSEPNKIIPKEIFNKFCLYNLKNESTTDEFNELQKIAQKNNLNYKKIQKESIIFVEEIKTLGEKINYEINDNSFNIILSEYLNIKSTLKDEEKTIYLKILLYLSEILEINLRELLTNKIYQKYSTQLIKNISNPLDDEEILNEMLNQRYNNGYFEIRQLYLPRENQPNNKKYDFLKLQSDITLKLITIFIKKIKDSLFNGLNQEYSNFIKEIDLERLEKLNRKEIYEILINIEKKESFHYICNKFNISENIYKFIEKISYETTNLNKEHIGIGKNSIFANENEQSIIEISFNGPNFETNLFLNEYIIKCIEQNLNYDMTGFNNNDNYRNKSSIYSSRKDFDSKISIINEIINKYPKWFKNFSTPILSSGKINNSIYGISTAQIFNDPELITYHEYFNVISEISYYRVLSKIIIGIINDKKSKEIIEYFINLKNVDINKSNLLLSKFNDIEFEIIKDIANQYIPSISNSLNIYMTDNEKKKEFISEFQKSMKYISNIFQYKEKKEKTNIALINITKNN